MNDRDLNRVSQQLRSGKVTPESVAEMQPSAAVFAAAANYLRRILKLLRCAAVFAAAGWLSFVAGRAWAKLGGAPFSGAEIRVCIGITWIICCFILFLLWQLMSPDVRRIPPFWRILPPGYGVWRQVERFLETLHKQNALCHPIYLLRVSSLPELVTRSYELVGLRRTAQAGLAFELYLMNRTGKR